MIRPALEHPDDLRRLLLQRPARDLGADQNDVHHAAVAVVFRRGTDDLEILFIRRSEHELDPWSGQIAFPGGRKDEADADLVATARRETEEELGLKLGAGTPSILIGKLDQLQARVRAKKLQLIIHPIAWMWTEAEAPVLAPSDDEVAEAFWVPINVLANGQRRGGFEDTYSGTRFFFPTIDFGTQGRLWGLTLRMVGEILVRLGRIEDVDTMSLPRALS